MRHASSLKTRASAISGSHCYIEQIRPYARPRTTQTRRERACDAERLTPDFLGDGPVHCPWRASAFTRATIRVICALSLAVLWALAPTLAATAAFAGAQMA